MAKEAAKTHEKIHRAFFALFKSNEDFVLFERDQAALNVSSEKLLQYAFEKKFIPQPSRNEFIAALSRRVPQEFDTRASDSFQACVNGIRGNMSFRQLTERITRTGMDIGLTSITPAMFTRLKAHFKSDSPAKRNLLRALTWWTTLNRPEQRLSFEMVCNLPGLANKKEPHKEGILLVLAIQSANSIIPSDAIQWLRDELKQAIYDLRFFPGIDAESIGELGATAVSLPLPRLAGFDSSPHLYTEAINATLALSHQMIVRWGLSEYAGAQRTLCIAIDAGPFDINQSRIQAILSLPPRAKSCIVLTEFAYFCARTADAKIVWEKTSSPIALYNQQPTLLRQVKHFWSHTYFDFIPILLEDEMLPVSKQTMRYGAFIQELYMPETLSASSFGALKAINRFPCSAHILLEIAKVCFARRMFHEADFIISKILIVDSLHMVARVMRMIIFCNLGAAHNNLHAAEISWEQALNEGKYCTELFRHEQEVWNEFGLINITISLRYLQHIRSDRDTTRPALQKKVMGYLADAERAFSTAATVSPTGKGNRAIYWLLYVKSIRELLASDQSHFNASVNSDMKDNNKSFFRIGLVFFASLGWISLPSDASKKQVDISTLPDEENGKLLAILDRVIGQFDTSVLSRNFIPNIKFSFCGLLWDFYPELTEPVCRRILTWIYQAESAAKCCSDDQISVYSSTGAMALLQDTAEFIRNLGKAKNMVLKMLELLHAQAEKPNRKTTSAIAGLRKNKFIMMFTDTI